MSAKSVDIFFKNIKCGVLSKKGDESFEFHYLEEYVKNRGESISISLPIQKRKFKSTMLFPFFEGLIPEGWLLSLAQKELRLNVNKDKFQILIALCQQSIGAVHVGENVKNKKMFSIESKNIKKFNFKKCLICYEEFNSKPHNEVYHIKCMKTVFKKEIVPYVDIDNKKIEELGKISLLGHKTITGVQKKLSLDLDNSQKGDRLTLTELWGKFIFKPKGNAPHFPENEHLSMMLAKIFGVITADCALIPQANGDLGFIARRFDKGDKDEEFHQEDFCQILMQTSNQKYTGSYEQIGKILKTYSTSPGNDCYRLFEMIIFNFIIGNIDLHLKNISFCYEDKKGKRNFLSPAYDILSTDLYIEDDEQLALAINGKKNKLKMNDFFALANSLSISEKVFKNIIEKVYQVLPAWFFTIESSFLSSEDQTKLKLIITQKLDFFDFSK